MKRIILINKIILSFITFIMIFSFNIDLSFAQVTDIDGNVYKTVKIGNQEWLAENLNVSHYRNGDLIPQVKDIDEWLGLQTGAWCYYENDSKYGKTYGKLYNWYAVNDPRGLVPDGWHIPSDIEWTQLSDFLGGVNVAGGKLKATTLWDSPNTGATNESGFTAVPGGICDDDGYGYIYGIGNEGSFWSSSESDNFFVWIREVIYDSSSLIRRQTIKVFGLSVRCFKD